jgi:hypothetical protein
MAREDNSDDGKKFLFFAGFFAIFASSGAKVFAAKNFSGRKMSLFQVISNSHANACD